MRFFKKQEPDHSQCGEYGDYGFFHCLYPDTHCPKWLAYRAAQDQKLMEDWDQQTGLCTDCTLPLCEHPKERALRRDLKFCLQALAGRSD